MGDNSDECVWCEQDHYWDCGPEPHCEPTQFKRLEGEGGPWRHVGRADITAGRYDIYCHRGSCRVVLKPVTP